ncbi:glycosyltransferase [Cupriavidus pinatubonensis]|uniref:glycosyltransferase n=1 Tax=Cupriavidus pinatubonensis TaxID=248026 RepID=UPI0015E3B9DD|nr:glycosyltransferase [Cupriavidus pinatubonensis]
MPIEWDFVYVADGQAHKNHLALLEAWRELALEGVKPRLALTLTSRDGHLINTVNAMRAECGANIHNIGQISHQEVLELYRCSRALIFPSQFESFGLPLVEAHELGLPILASELDYVRDVCSPEQTFDPNSPLSIVRAVKRFLDIPESMPAMYSPRDFLRELFETEPE